VIGAFETQYIEYSHYLFLFFRHIFAVNTNIAKICVLIVFGVFVYVVLVVDVGSVLDHTDAADLVQIVAHFQYDEYTIVWNIGLDGLWTGINTADVGMVCAIVDVFLPCCGVESRGDYSRLFLGNIFLYFGCDGIDAWHFVLGCWIGD